MNIATISNYVKTHERLILVLAAVGLVLFLGNKYLNYNARHADEKLAQAQLLSQQQEAKVQQLTKDVTTAYQASTAATEAANRNTTALQAQINQLQTTLSIQKQKVQSESLTEVGTTLEHLIEVPNGVDSVNGGLTLTDAAARSTVNKLLEGQELGAELTDKDKIIATKDLAVSAQSETIRQGQILVAGLNTLLDINKNECKKEVDQVKAEARKSKRNWFIVGYVAGLVTRSLVTKGF